MICPQSRTNLIEIGNGQLAQANAQKLFEHPQLEENVVFSFVYDNWAYWALYSDLG